MQMAAFSAKSPYEIGDTIQVIDGKAQKDGGALYMIRPATITDIACTHFLRSGRTLFIYELDGSGEYIPLITAKEAGLTV